MNSKEINDYLESLGLVNIRALDPSIKTDIRYATPNNFTGNILYDELYGVYAEPELARRVAAANSELHRIFPDYNIVVFDATRPLKVQYKMFDLVKGTEMEPYIALPSGEYPGGFHNYGMAVDISICDGNGQLLDMGTDFDSFSSLAHAGNERQLVADGLMTTEVYANRSLLYYLTGCQSLMPYPYEWWHYQYYQNEEDKKLFKLIDF